MSKLSMSERLRIERQKRDAVFVPHVKTTVPRKKKVVAQPNKIQILETIMQEGLKSTLPDYIKVARSLQGQDKNANFQAKRIKDFLDLLLTTYTVVEKHD